MSDETASRCLSTTRETIAQALSTIRQRTLDIVAPVSESGLGEQHSPLMSPIVWDLGHIAEFEDLWLVERLGEVVRESALPETFDAMRTPRSRRGELDLPGRAAILARLQDVRSRALDTLSRVDLDASGNRLLAGGFVYELVREHEAQHQETILQTIFLMESEPYAPVSRRQFGSPGRVEVGEMVAVPAGPFEMGAPTGPFAYDNELPRHNTRTDAFEIEHSEEGKEGIRWRVPGVRGRRGIRRWGAVDGCRPALEGAGRPGGATVLASPGVQRCVFVPGRGRGSPDRGSGRLGAGHVAGG